MNRDIQNELMELATDWNRAMVENDAEAIGQYMAEDWTIIGADGSLGDKATFLGLVRSGVLRHGEMTSENRQVRVYGDTAVIISRGISGGTYHGQPFREVDRASCVFVRQAAQWGGVLTHLSRLSPEGSP